VGQKSKLLVLRNMSTDSEECECTYRRACSDVARSLQRSRRRTAGNDVIDRALGGSRDREGGGAEAARAVQ